MAPRPGRTSRAAAAAANDDEDEDDEDDEDDQDDEDEGGGGGGGGRSCDEEDKKEAGEGATTHGRLAEDAMTRGLRLVLRRAHRGTVEHRTGAALQELSLLCR